MEVEEASCLRHEADIVLCSSGKKKHVCIWHPQNQDSYPGNTHSYPFYPGETQGHPFYPDSGSLPSLLLV